MNQKEMKIYLIQTKNSGKKIKLFKESYYLGVEATTTIK